MKLREILKKVIKDAGADGLCNEELRCGCGLDDNIPCDLVNLNCELAKFEPTFDGDNPQPGPKNGVWYVPLEAEAREE